VYRQLEANFPTSSKISTMIERSSWREYQSLQPLNCPSPSPHMKTLEVLQRSVRLWGPTPLQSMDPSHHQVAYSMNQGMKGEILRHPHLPLYIFCISWSICVDLNPPRIWWPLTL
jgi:hypothetical protein